jgi:repressor LexA
MTNRQNLTDRQREVLGFIEAKIARDGYPPTIREIGEHLGIRSTNGVTDHLKALQRKGVLSRTESKSRACVPVQPPQATPSRRPGAPVEQGWGRRTADRLTPVELVDDSVSVPVRGRIAAGAPIAAIDSREDTVRIDRFFLGKNKDVFALRVVGESMIEDGIHDGDFIFVRKQQAAPRGAIVVAMIEGEATVKRFYHEGHRVRFQPANSAMQPIYVAASEFRETQIVGVVVGIYRTMD